LVSLLERGKMATRSSRSEKVKRIFPAIRCEPWDRCVGGLAQKKQRTAAWVVSPNHGIVFDNKWEIVNDLEILIKRLKAKQAKVSMVVPSSEMEGRRRRAEGEGEKEEDER
jgi:hypothetical protein